MDTLLANNVNSNKMKVHRSIRRIKKNKLVLLNLRDLIELIVFDVTFLTLNSFKKYDV